MDLAGAVISDVKCGPVGDTFLTFSDGRVLRLSLGGNLKADGALWRSSTSICVNPSRYVFTVCGELPTALVTTMADRELDVFLAFLADTKEVLDATIKLGSQPELV